jgi:hypothetical protein
MTRSGAISLALAFVTLLGLLGPLSAGLAALFTGEVTLR